MWSLCQSKALFQLEEVRYRKILDLMLSNFDWCFRFIDDFKLIK